MNKNSSKRTFVGFGFGAIQTGLFLHEAIQSGNFSRLVIAEVLPEVIDAIRENDGATYVNVAYQDHVEIKKLENIEIYNPNDVTDREELINAIAQAHEISTAVPSVKFYKTNNPGSIHHILTEGIRKKLSSNGPKAVIYTAENNNHAAEILNSHIKTQFSNQEQADIAQNVQVLNTVIGKMSRVVIDVEEINDQNLQSITGNINRAVLVESFNKILISKIDFEESFKRGIEVFEEKDDLYPFEEAKLFGHNATHALIGYFGLHLGINYVDEIKKHKNVFSFIQDAFIEESGKALISKYNNKDIMFTSEGYEEYANDLIRRMTNPFLADTIARITRDPKRKLGWNDRLIGTIRLCLSQKIEPIRFGMGACAAISYLEIENHHSMAEKIEFLKGEWQPAAKTAEELGSVCKLLDHCANLFEGWKASQFAGPAY